MSEGAAPRSLIEDPMGITETDVQIVGTRQRTFRSKGQHDHYHGRPIIIQHMTVHCHTPAGDMSAIPVPVPVAVALPIVPPPPCAQVSLRALRLLLVLLLFLQAPVNAAKEIPAQKPVRQPVCSSQTPALKEPTSANPESESDNLNRSKKRNCSPDCSSQAFVPKVWFSAQTQMVDINFCPQEPASPQSIFANPESESSNVPDRSPFDDSQVVPSIFFSPRSLIPFAAETFKKAPGGAKICVLSRNSTSPTQRRTSSEKNVARDIRRVRTQRWKSNLPTLIPRSNSPSAIYNQHK